MKELYSFVDNKIKVNTFKYIVYIIIGLIIIDQIYSLSVFVYNYSKNFDYGKMLKETCNINYIEYETERFQLANNIMNLKISNDNYNNRYNILILFITIFITLFINYIVVYMFLRSVFDEPLSALLNIMEIIGKATGSPLEKASQMLLQIQSSIGNMLESNSIMTKIINYILFFGKILLLLYLIAIIPVYLILKFNNNIDISPFVNNKDNYISHSVILVVIFVTIVSVNKEMSYFTKIIYFFIFVLSFFLLYVISNLYISIKNSNNEKNIFENSSNNNLKYDSFVRNYRYHEFKDNILEYFFKEILGLNYNVIGNLTFFNTKSTMLPDISFINDETIDKFKSSILNFELGGIGEDQILGENNNEGIFGNLNKYIKIDSYKSGIFFLLVLLACILALCLLLYLKPDNYSFYGTFSKNSDDIFILYNLAFIPLLIVFIVLIIIVLTKEYNTYINQYILYNSNSLYRRKIDNINKIFNKILINDKAKINNNSTCVNVVNGIYLIIYSQLFKNSYNKITPEFKYIQKCDINDYIDYNKIKEYSFDYYINQKSGNIFYSNTKCSSVDNELLINIIKNTSIKEIFDSIIVQGDDKRTIYTNLKNTLQKHFKYSVYNILNGQTYTKNKPLKFTNDFSSNNQLLSYQIKDDELQNINIDINNINTIDLIIDEYIKYLKIIFEYNIKAIQALCNCNNLVDPSRDKNYDTFINKIPEIINSNISEKNQSKDYSMNIKKEYIDRFTRTTQIFFNKINRIFSVKVKISDENLKLTKYITKNYNEYQTYISDKHNNLTFNEKDLNEGSSVKEDMKYKDIENISKLINDILVDLKRLSDILKNYKDDNRKDIEDFNTSYIIFDNNLKNFSLYKSNYETLFKNKYKTNTNYYVQLIFDYKISFLNAYAKMYENIKMLLSNRSNLFKENKEKTLQELDKYILEYVNDRTLYERKYTTLEFIENDIFKDNVDILYSKKMSISENNSKLFLKAAENTSSHIYVVVACYISLIIISTIIK